MDRAFTVLSYAPLAVLVATVIGCVVVVNQEAALGFKGFLHPSGVKNFSE